MEADRLGRVVVVAAVGDALAKRPAEPTEVVEP
jgi:hypothetical protein